MKNKCEHDDQDQTKLIDIHGMEQEFHTMEVEKQPQDKEEGCGNLFTRLSKALERAEFEVYYQPYFGIDKNDIGVEALIRWNHPNFGLLSPASFLGVAEETGFIIELEKWVLTKSTYEVKNLHQKGLKDLTLSVNISAGQLANPEFPMIVFDLLRKLSFHPEHLTLEITERFHITHDNIEVLQRLRESGIQISIDDFGTSYSSLQYLKDLPIDELKIDRSFISYIDIDLNSQKIVNMIIMLGHQLNLKIVAEGVERNKQYHLLKNMNCDKAQGFLLSKPLPLSKFEQMYVQKFEETVTW